MNIVFDASVLVSARLNQNMIAWALENSLMPKAACKLWAILPCYISRKTAEICASRDKLAELIGVRPDDISTLMTEFEKAPIKISRRRSKVPGMKGRGTVKYFVDAGVVANIHHTGSGPSGRISAA